jgi:hypothetical protein
MTGRRSEVRRLAALTGVAAALLLVAGPAAASAAAPHWRINSYSNTTAQPGDANPNTGEFHYLVEIQVEGSVATSGQVNLTASLPPGILATKVVKVVNLNALDCSATVFPASVVHCKDTTDPITANSSFGVLRIFASVDESAPPATVTAHFTVSGGAAPAAPGETADPTRIDPELPPFGVDAFDGLVSGPGGSAYTAAAGHPDSISTYIDFNTATKSAAGGAEAPLKGDYLPVAPAKDIDVDLPPGFVGIPTGIEQCSNAALANVEGYSPIPLCSPESQVGVASLRFAGGANPGFKGPTIPVFEMIPPPGVPARFGFQVNGVVITLDAKLRSGSDYGLTVGTQDASEALAFAGSTVTFWGTPASHSHDEERHCRGEAYPYVGGLTCPSIAPERAFLRNPTSCGAPPVTGLRIDSWFEPGVFAQSSFAAHEPPGYPFSNADPATPWGAAVGTTGCEQVPFEPSITVRPTSKAADSPTGLDVDLTMPQEALTNPDAIAQADVKDSVVTQPLGTRVNPAAADGLTGCSEAQVGLHDTEAPTCPSSSRIGSVEIVTPLQENPLKGGIYQARQGENPSHSTLAFYTVASGEGVVIKLAAEVKTDPETGQVTTVFKDNPQLPFEHYRLHFDTGPRAPLITPPACGTFTTSSTFTGWANPEEPVHGEDSFQITEGPNGTPCPPGAAGRPFAPSFSAGTTSPLAGAFAPFVLKLGREDGTQELTGLDTTLPPGLIGRLAGVAECSAAQIAVAQHNTGAAERANPSCPSASAVGVTDAAAGAGPLPFHTPGTAYLAGPYKGAPLSLAIVTPAVAGPLDLGTVVVRAALFVNETTTQIRALSDPLPLKIVQGGDGFPLDLRSVTVNMNRPSFTLNPTSCDPMAVTGTVGGTFGASAAVSDRFQVGNCAALPFKPKLSFRLKGGAKRGDNPAFSATLTAKAGEANIAAVSVTLPHSEFLDQGHIKTICTRVQFAAGQCPKGSVYGYAKAITPLLDKPLEGPVYLRSSDNELPDLVADLSGQIHVVLDGHIDSVNKGIRNRFELVPDAPVSKFTLTMQGGKKGLLQNSRDLCKSVNKATVLMDGQNGKVFDTEPVVQSSCKSKGAKGKRHKQASHRLGRSHR